MWTKATTQTSWRDVEAFSATYAASIDECILAMGTERSVNDGCTTYV